MFFVSFHFVMYLGVFLSIVSFVLWICVCVCVCVCRVVVKVLIL